jgi:putative oxidoreductase
MTAGRLIARLTIGGLFVGHGTQKLFGWFGGPGPEGTTGMMDKLDMHPPRRNAMAAAGAETVGGALLALGAFTPAAAAMLSGTMFTAIRKVHFKKGLWNTGGGYEYNATLIVALAALVECGPGSPSVDRALGIERTGARWALASIAAGVIGSTLAVEAGEQEAEHSRQASQPAPAEAPSESEGANGRPAPAGIA